MENGQGQANAGGAAAPRPLQMGAKGAYIVRLLMVGDSACGKTSLVLRFDQNVFSTKFVTTIGVDYRDKMVKVRASFLGLIDCCCCAKKAKCRSACVDSLEILVAFRWPWNSSLPPFSLNLL